MARKPCTRCQSAQAVRPGGLCNRCFGEKPPVTKFPVEELPLSGIMVDHRIQARDGLDSATIERYVEELSGGAEFPPAVVFKADDDIFYLLSEGFHRYEAHKSAGRTTIRCEVRPGTFRDAKLQSIGSNADHGLQRTREDMRRAVEMLLGDAEWGQLSVTEIARLSRTSWSFADRVRSEWHARTATPEPATRTRSDGRQAPARTKAKPYTQSVGRGLGGPDDDGGDSIVGSDPVLAAIPIDAERPVSHVFDALGVPVPESVQPAWETAAALKAVAKLIRQAGKETESLRGKPGTEKLALQTVLNHLENAQKTVGDATPRHVCPQCDGLTPPAGCTCQGRGWLAESGFDALPLNLKRKAERYQSRRA